MISEYRRNPQEFRSQGVLLDRVTNAHDGLLNLKSLRARMFIVTRHTSSVLLNRVR